MRRHEELSRVFDALRRAVLLGARRTERSWGGVSREVAGELRLEASPNQEWHRALGRRCAERQRARLSDVRAGVPGRIGGRVFPGRVFRGCIARIHGGVASSGVPRRPPIVVGGRVRFLAETSVGVRFRRRVAGVREAEQRAGTVVVLAAVVTLPARLRSAGERE